MTEEETAFCSIILQSVIKVYREIITLWSGVNETKTSLFL